MSARWARWPTSRARTTSSGPATSRTPTRSIRASSTSCCEHVERPAPPSGNARSSARTRRASTASRTSTSAAARPACLSSISLVRGGTVVDGSGLPAYTADVGVRDGRITAVGRLGDDSREPHDRRRRLRRGAGLRRHPHALRRAAALRAHRVAVVVARRHHRDHRELRVLAVPGPTRRTSPGCCEMLSRVEGMSADDPGRRA